MKRPTTMFAAALALSAGVADAQFYNPAQGFANAAPMSRFLSSSFLAQQVVNDTSFRQGVVAAGRVAPKRSGADAPRIVTVVAATGAPVMPSRLAQAYPAAARGEVERVFARLLATYPEVEREFGVPRGDLAAAVAVFLAGSYEAYRNISLEPRDFKALIVQMRGAIGAHAAIAGASDAQKQELYEQMAIVGLFMAGVQDELQRKPDAKIAADMKVAAKGYLEQFLKTDAQRVRIDANGLSLQ